MNINSSINALHNDKRVDKYSLKSKLDEIENLIGEAKVDKEAEIIAGAHILKLSSIKYLSFSERPDIIITITDESKHGFEVKRFRARDEDGEDEKKIKKRFTRYGKYKRSDGKESWVEEIIERIDAKNIKSYKTLTTSLFLISDSSLQIERGEIIDAVKRKWRVKFCTIFFDTVWKENSGIDYILLNEHKMSKELASEIRKNDHFFLN
jgi:hypothetical protein